MNPRIQKEKDIIMLVEEIRDMRYIRKDLNGAFNDVIRNKSIASYEDLKSYIMEQPSQIKSELRELNSIYLEYYPINEKLRKLLRILSNKSISSDVKKSFEIDYNATLHRKKLCMNRFMSKESFIMKFGAATELLDDLFFKNYKKQIKKSTKDHLPINIDIINQIAGFPTENKEKFDEILKDILDDYFDYEKIDKKLSELLVAIACYKNFMNS